ncbi:MAG: hypothetical protein ACRDPT_09485 [Streptomycetales bacterium]
MTSTASDAPAPGHASLGQAVAELAIETAPRRFALCAIDEDAEDAFVLFWGLAFPAGAAVTDGQGRPIGSFTSAGSARRAFGRGRACGRHLHLVWIDP